MTLTLAVMLATLSAAGPDDEFELEQDKVEQVERRRVQRRFSRNHVELSFGYLAQWADERSRALELESSAGDGQLAGAVTEPFVGVPFSGAMLAGPTLELRAVCDRVRLTVGARFPFTGFRPVDTAHSITLNGAPHEVLVRSVSLWDLRTGLGFEVPFTRVTPFVDVLGDVETLTTQLSIDGAAATYTGRAFSLGGRLGLRAQLSHVFLQAAVEATALGPLRYGGSLQVGLAL